MDKFDLFENPHNERQETDDDRNRIKSLYADKKHPNCVARFAPENMMKKITMSDQYFCYVDALQYIFVRNYEKGSIIQRISLA